MSSRTANDQLGGSITVGDAQASTTASFVDYLLPSANSPALGYAGYMLTLALSGSHTNTAPGASTALVAMAQVSWHLRDDTTGDVYAHGVFDTSDATPNTTLHIPVSQALVHPGDPMRIEVDLATYAYVMSNDAPQYLTAVADYRDTLMASLDAATPGANTVGVSGYDYAGVPSVPEPGSAWLLVLGGCGLIGLRRGAAGGVQHERFQALETAQRGRRPVVGRGARVDAGEVAGQPPGTSGGVCRTGREAGGGVRRTVGPNKRPAGQPLTSPSRKGITESSAWPWTWWTTRSRAPRCSSSRSSSTPARPPSARPAA